MALSLGNGKLGMWLKGYAFALLGLGAITGVGAFIATKAHGMADIQCKITKQSSDRGMVLTGTVTAPEATVGDYHFMVSKQGPAGSSNVVQRGLFSVDANSTGIVGTVSINFEQGDTLWGRLTVSREGFEICTAEFT